MFPNLIRSSNRERGFAADIPRLISDFLKQFWTVKGDYGYAILLFIKNGLKVWAYNLNTFRICIRLLPGHINFSEKVTWSMQNGLLEK